MSNFCAHLVMLSVIFSYSLFIGSCLYSVLLFYLYFHMSIRLKMPFCTNACALSLRNKAQWLLISYNQWKYSFEPKKKWGDFYDLILHFGILNTREVHYCRDGIERDVRFRWVGGLYVGILACIQFLSERKIIDRTVLLYIFVMVPHMCWTVICDFHLPAREPTVRCSRCAWLSRRNW